MLMTTVWRKGRSAGENWETKDAKSEPVKSPESWKRLVSTADLKAQAASVEAGFVHGAVLVHEATAQVPLLQGVELAVGVVMEQLLGQMQQRSQLTQSVAIRLHLGGVVLGPEEGAAVVGGDVTALVNDVKKTRLQDLNDKDTQSGVWTGTASPPPPRTNISMSFSTATPCSPMNTFPPL